MLYIIMGKSSSGKDTIYRRLTCDEKYMLNRVVTYTTRPMRENEVQGREYHFVGEDEMRRLENAGKVVERRTYDTVYGEWHYFTVDDGSWNIDDKDYVIIGTLESYEEIAKYFGGNRVKPVYVQVDDGVRLERALARERCEKQPKYAEMCRRFLADEEDFKEENLRRLGIEKRFDNNDIEECIKGICEYMNLLR